MLEPLDEATRQRHNSLPFLLLALARCPPIARHVDQQGTLKNSTGGVSVSQRMLTLLSLFACFLGMNASLMGQDADAARGIMGYLDPRTGVFRSDPQPAQPDATPPALTTFAGKFVFHFTLTVNANIAATAKIMCVATAQVEDNLTGGTLNSFSETAAALAVRSGSTARCTVNIPYSWNLATGATDAVTLGYHIQAPTEITSVTAALPFRNGIMSDIATIPVPTTGTTTNKSVAVTF